MSELTPTATSVAHPLRSHWIVALSALFALLAVAAVVLVLAINDESTSESAVAQSSQPALRADNGPEESAIAASVGLPASAGPSESHIAAAIGAPTAEQPRPDEAGIAAAVAGR